MPTCADLTFDDDELRLIRSVTDDTGRADWDDAALANVRRKIKEHFLEVMLHMCAYCQRPLNGEFQMVIDVEHILPKHIFYDLMFEPENLTVACKRCNLGIKKGKWNFVGRLDEGEVRAEWRTGATYEIAHPNYDDVFEHLELLILQRGSRRVMAYKTYTNKGDATFNFFELKRLEIEQFDRSQGIESSASDLANDVAKLFI